MTERPDRELDLTRYHERARRRGVIRPVYWLARGILQPAMRAWFRLERHGRENVPRRGPVILDVSARREAAAASARRAA